MSVDWGLAGSVILTGLALVFAILIILILVVEITGRIINSRPNGGSAGDAKANPAPEKSGPVTPKAPVVQAGIEDETVAAIMAAVSCMTDAGSGAKYAVKSINRPNSGRPVWGFAGMQQNTRPF